MGVQDESEILKMLVQRIESSVASLPDGLLQNPPTIIKGISRERLSPKQEQMLDRINTIFMKVTACNKSRALLLIQFYNTSYCC